MRFTSLLIVFIALFAANVVAQEPPAPAKEYNLNAWKEFKSDNGHFSISVPGTFTPRDSFKVTK